MIFAIAEAGIASGEVTLAVLAGVKRALGAVPPDECAHLCLDTLVHLANARGGLMLDAAGARLARVGVSEADETELATLAYESWLHDGVRTTVLLPGGRVDAVRMPLRVNGRVTGMLVLTAEHTPDGGPDLGGLVPVIAGIARELHANAVAAS